ncbi:MAG TPA: hypothetical protein PKU96_06455 [bacterium]|nr:MAG: hypothetical protein BWY40_00175 [bacterium ADurb.Bin270]HPW45993.1 hypothetical protein [bacterium]
MKLTGRGISLSSVVVACLLFAATAQASPLDEGYAMERSGNLEGAAKFFCGYSQTNLSDKKWAPESLVKCARLLDSLADSFTERAEKKCYWSGGGDPTCMQREAAALNSQYGPGSFEYVHAIVYIPYTGVHYKTLMSKYPGSKYAQEADFYLLLRELVGHPDNVFPRVKAYLARHPKGEWHRKGLLLWARVNEDVWYVHRKWSWVLFNYQISPEELLIRSEPYRQEALRTYKILMKDSNTFEGQAAAREYAVLNDNRDDSVVYSIVNDSSPGTLAAWGIEAPRPQRPAEGTSVPQSQIPQISSPKGTAAPSATPGDGGAYRKAPSVPKRWD